MKLIQEANADEVFNKQMLKIQDAIEALEKLELEHPVTSQVRMLQVSSDDLKKLSEKMAAARTVKGMK